MSPFYQPIDQQEILYLIYLLLKIDIDVDMSKHRFIFAVYYLSNFSYFLISVQQMLLGMQTDKIDLLSIKAATILCLVLWLVEILSSNQYVEVVE